MSESIYFHDKNDIMRFTAQNMCLFVFIINVESSEKVLIFLLHLYSFSMFKVHFLYKMF